MRNTYTIQKTYFRNNRRFGRTTTLLKNGEIVLVLMDAVPKYRMIDRYENGYTPISDQLKGEVGPDDLFRPYAS